MLDSIITNTVGFIILVNNVRTQNNENTSILTTGQARRQQKSFTPAMLYDEKIPMKKKYDLDKIDSLFEEQFNRFIYDANKHNETVAKKYYAVFKENIKRINYLNKFYDDVTFSINAYTHFEFDEFTNWFTGFNSTGLKDDDVILFDKSVVQNLPPMMDWSDNILPDYYQETKCKNSYVLSALSNIGAQYFASNGNIKFGTLSIKQAFECERQGSCEYGGVPHYVFQALKDTGGVSLMHIYPDLEPNVKSDTCQTTESNVLMVIHSYMRLKVEKEEDLLYLLAYYGPVVTTIYASESIRHYSRGVLNPGDCGNNASNHAVLLAGYGVDDQYHLPYWHVKGTWNGWGDGTYIRFIRGKGFVCNLGREYIATSFVNPKRYIELNNNNN